jgi:CRP-like cAMP-binding protein
MLMRTPTQIQLPRTPSPSRRKPIKGCHWFVESLDEALELMGAAMPFSRNMEIYGEGEPAEYLYKVLQGAVRTHKL